MSESPPDRPLAAVAGAPLPVGVLPSSMMGEPPCVDEALPVLYRDEWLIAVDKPSGLSVHRGWDRSHRVAMRIVRDMTGCHVWPVHRLDRSASGVLLLALQRDAARALHTAFAQGTVAKRYVALVRGALPPAGVIDHPLRRTPAATPVDAVTQFETLAVIARDDLPRAYSLVRAAPTTGRLHQIRRHFKHMSHPLIGDVNYGKGEHNRLFRIRFGLHRLFLHAVQVSLVHPITGTPLVIDAPLPAELCAVLDGLGVARGTYDHDCIAHAAGAADD